MGEVRIQGHATHAILFDYLFNGTDSVHAIVGIDAPETEKLIRIGSAELQHTVIVVLGAVRGTRIAAGNDRANHTALIKISHDFGQGLGRELIKMGGIRPFLEHCAFADAIEDGTRVGPEPEIKNFHIFSMNLHIFRESRPAESQPLPP